MYRLLSLSLTNRYFLTTASAESLSCTMENMTNASTHSLDGISSSVTHSVDNVTGTLKDATNSSLTCTPNPSQKCIFLHLVLIYSFGKS